MHCLKFKFSPKVLPCDLDDVQASPLTWRRLAASRGACEGSAATAAPVPWSSRARRGTISRHRSPQDGRPGRASCVRLLGPYKDRLEYQYKSEE